MNRLSIFGFRSRIALPFVITAAALVFVGLFSINTIRNLVLDVDEMAEHYIPAVSEVLNGDRDLYQALTAQFSYVDGSFNGEDTAKYLASFDENVQQANDRFNLAVSRLKGAEIGRASCRERV